VTRPAAIAAAAALLAGAALSSSAVAAEAAAGAEAKQVCKRYVPVGSLQRAKRVCKTQAEWQSERDAARTEGERLTERISGDREVPEMRPAGAPN
jgi:hypothetical protein